MAYLFFDTETTGLPNFKNPINHPDQPRICQLAAILTDKAGRTKAEINALIKPDGWSIPAQASEIHGITQEDAEKYGLSMKGVLGIFSRLLAMADTVVAHNISFDAYMIKREGVALQFPASVYSFNEHCTMREATPIVKMPPSAKMLACGMKGYKSPSLQETHHHFFGKHFDGAHDAMADVRACRDVFFKMRQLKEAEAA